MKVPVLDGPSVAPSGEAAPGGAPVYGQASGAVGGALSRLGSTVGGTVDELVKTMDRARDKANAVQVSQALADTEADFQLVTRGASDPGGQQKLEAMGVDPRGYLNIKGLKEASAASQPTTSAMEKALEARAAAITDDRAKAEYRARATHLYNTYHEAIETHFSKQREDDVKAQGEGTAAQHLGIAASGGYATANQAANARIVAEQSLRQLGWSPAAIQNFRERANAAMVAGLIQNGKLADAQDFVDREANQLGTLFPEVKAEVNRAVGNTAKDLQLGAQQMAVRGIVKASTDAQGMASLLAIEAKAEESGLLDPAKNPHWQEARIQVDRAKVEAAHLADAKLDQAENVLRQVVRTPSQKDWPQGASESIAFLKQYDRKRYDAVMREAEMDFKRWDAERNGSPAERRAEAARQRELALEYQHRWNATVTTNPDADLRQFTQDYIQEKRAAGVDVSLPGSIIAAGQQVQAQRKKEQGSKEESARRAFAQAVEMEAKSLPGIKKSGGKLDQDKLQTYVGNALKWYDVEGGGKPLNLEQSRKLQDRLVSEHVVTSPGRFWDTKGLLIETAPPVAPAASDQSPASAPATAPSPAAAPEVSPKPAARPAVRVGTVANLPDGTRKRWNGKVWESL